MRKAFFVVGLAASTAGAQEAPAQLTALAAKAQFKGSLTAWCHAEFQSGHPGAFAVAVTTASGGRYVALDVDGRVMELGSFERRPDLSCYSRAEAEALDAAIGRSQTIHGHITPRWNTTIVCGFVDDTSAVCWQYAPANRAFVQVGQWVT